MPQIQIAGPQSRFERPEDGLATICALGDLMLAGQWKRLPQEQGKVDRVLGDLVRLYQQDDLTFANLEVTLEGPEGHIDKEPRLITDADSMTAYLKTLKIDILNLSNNHAFDGRSGGFEAVRQVLGNEGVSHLGAGLNLGEAAQGLVTETKGLRFGWLAYTEPSTKPSHIATSSQPGVNPLSVPQTLVDIERLADEVDHVIVSLHWGVEYCHLPSPRQVEIARSMIARGARLILGHHAHVIQGVEAHLNGVIVYNMGNAIATDLKIGNRLAIRQTAKTRSTFVVRALFGKNHLARVELVPFMANVTGVSVGAPCAARILSSANSQLARGISEPRWRVRRLYEDVLVRTLRKMDPRVAGSLSPAHFAKFFKNISNAFKGRGPA